VPALDDEIGRDDDPRVRRGDDGGVVTRADDDTVDRSAEPGDDARDQPELAGVGDGDGGTSSMCAYRTSDSVPHGQALEGNP
jgi:hypothetical protein